jgi:O-acetyl-ADP-ribose deacetylase (regulator of RNase III)
MQISTKIGQATLVLKQGDITREETDAIVNAANNAILGGGGVDGAIHSAAGPVLLQECITLRMQQTEKGEFVGCATGDAVITKAGNLKAKHVIHAVGPDARLISTAEAAKLLKSAYAKSLELAEKNQLRIISFPSISTGIYAYPIEEAAKIALETIAESLKNSASLSEVRIVLFSASDFAVYQAALKQLKALP